MVVCAHLAVHAVLIGLKRGELWLIGAVTVFGLVLDQALFASGLFLVEGASAPAPLWLSCLWPVLATTFMHAFETLQRHLALAAVLGAVGGGLSYLAGTRLSNVEFADPTAGPLLIAGLWFVLMPLLLMAARRAAQAGEAVSA